MCAIVHTPRGDAIEYLANKSMDPLKKIIFYKRFPITKKVHRNSEFSTSIKTFSLNKAYIMNRKKFLLCNIHKFKGVTELV